MSAEHPLLLVCSFAGGAAVTFLLTPLVVLLATRNGAVDRPGGRKAHAEATPRLGGVAVFAGLLAGAAAYYFAFGWEKLIYLVYAEEHLSLFVPCAIIFVLGMADDLWGLSPTVRVLVEAMAAVIVMQAGYLIDELWTPWGTVPLGLLGYPLTVLWFVGVANSFNLVDGIDGLVSSIGIASLLGCAGVALLVYMQGTAFLPLALAGALLGFLPWNWHRARIFMGDSGSLFIGFAAAALALKVSRYESGGVALHVMIALCARPAVETFLTLARRYASGRAFSSGDQSHIHHVLIAHKGLTIRRAVVMLALVQVLFSGMAMASRMRLGWYALVPVGGLLLFVMIFVRWLDYLELRVVWHSLVQGLSRPRRPALAHAVDIARAGSGLRRAGSPRELAETVKRVVGEGRFSYIGIEFTDLGARAVGYESPSAAPDTAQAGPHAEAREAQEAHEMHEVHNVEAARYVAGLGDAPHWVFSTDGGRGAQGPPFGGAVSFSIPLPVEDGRYGRLVCQREYYPRSPRPAAEDVRRYLAEPVAEVLERLEGASSRRSGGRSE